MNNQFDPIRLSLKSYSSLMSELMIAESLGGKI